MSKLFKVTYSVYTGPGENSLPKVPAIKGLRLLSEKPDGSIMGLKEAKETVEAYAEKYDYTDGCVFDFTVICTGHGVANFVAATEAADSRLILSSVRPHAPDDAIRLA